MLDAEVLPPLLWLRKKNVARRLRPAHIMMWVSRDYGILAKQVTDSES
jgi:hypothetical protein